MYIFHSKMILIRQLNKTTLKDCHTNKKVASRNIGIQSEGVRIQKLEGAINLNCKMQTKLRSYSDFIMKQLLLICVMSLKLLLFQVLKP